MQTTILSPHTDDAILSLWGVLAGPGEVSVINVFDGVPEGQQALGWWDRMTHAQDPIARAEERRAEDGAALGLLDRRALSLGFVDEQYRNGDRNGETMPEALVDCIERALPSKSAVLAPAALGEHPDHTRTRSAALELRERGFPVTLYADIPHATPHGWPAWVTGGSQEADINAASRWEDSMRAAGLSARELAPTVRALSPAEQARKREAIECYRSQLAGLRASFPLFSRPEILSYEVIWRLPGR
jgi:LmbE family N-acetylglucosaminyl deacetylase